MKRIAAYRGTNRGHDPSHVRKAYDSGRYFAEQGYELVFDAGSVGTMGAIQDGVLDHGGKAVGVMPKMLDEHEITSQRSTESILVSSAYERKNKVVELADVFVMVLGGTDSSKGFFEAYSWTQVGVHEKLIAIYNINGFFNPLQTMIDHMIEEGFIDPKYRALAPLRGAKGSLIGLILNFKPLGTRSYD